MARATKEWIGRADDSKAPPRVRLRIFRAHDGICYLSKRKIAAGEKWELHHIKALIEGGENRERNLAPVLVGPHKAETKRQVAIKTKTDAMAMRHHGIREQKQPIKSAGFPKSPKRPAIDKSALGKLGGTELQRRLGALERNHNG